MMTNTLRVQASFYTKTLMGVAVIAALAVMALAARPAYAETATVTNINDSGAGSLRAAMNGANANPGLDNVNFDIPGTGVHTIAPQTALPTITDPVVIDGYTQPGSSPNTLAEGDDAKINIDLDGSAVTGDGLLIRSSTSAANTTVRGLAIHDFGAAGIRIEDGAINPTIHVHIEGNFVGTDPTGAKDKGNESSGVIADNSKYYGKALGGHVIGGATPASRNVISGNGYKGVSIIKSDGNTVQGNYIGTDRDGTDALTGDDMGNYLYGVSVSGSKGNKIGGYLPGEGNVIANNYTGVQIENLSSLTKVYGNKIGTDRTGKKNLGNGTGVNVEDANFNDIGSTDQGGANVIAFNEHEGVRIDDTSNTPDDTYHNRISANSIFSNGGLGIDLGGNGATPNDTGDADAGPNGYQNRPVITSAKQKASGETIITVTLDSVPSTGYVLQFFSNPEGTDEGKTYLGGVYRFTDATGHLSYTFSTTKKIKLGKNITATATSGPSSDTSEFSAPKKVVAS